MDKHIIYYTILKKPARQAAVHTLLNHCDEQHAVGQHAQSQMLLLHRICTWPALQSGWIELCSMLQSLTAMALFDYWVNRQFVCTFCASSHLFRNGRRGESCGLHGESCSESKKAPTDLTRLCSSGCDLACSQAGQVVTLPVLYTHKANRSTCYAALLPYVSCVLCKMWAGSSHGTSACCPCTEWSVG